MLRSLSARLQLRQLRASLPAPALQRAWLSEVRLVEWGVPLWAGVFAPRSLGFWAAPEAESTLGAAGC